MQSSNLIRESSLCHGRLLMQKLTAGQNVEVSVLFSCQRSIQNVSIPQSSVTIKEKKIVRDRGPMLVPSQCLTLSENWMGRVGEYAEGMGGEEPSPPNHRKMSSRFSGNTGRHLSTHRSGNGLILDLYKIKQVNFMDCRGTVSFFFYRILFLGRLITLYWMVPHPRVYEKHKLESRTQSCE